ncbi:hypothetical protein [Deinococcus roseus]|uniref:Uncharacterized protein n=1 Tax=Deinococcus roseus TaxID=392414 RepID=A0ABQ2D4Y3_9DEIO|nr:hypothetical protein [Deinococcus roseus]GGJ46222.1 hypothetical protein GCM10008938_35530 [Deinococcus roseus]
MNTFQTQISGWNLNGKDLPEWLMGHLSGFWNVPGLTSSVQGKLNVVYLPEAPAFPTEGLPLNIQTPAGNVQGFEKTTGLWLGTEQAGIRLEHRKNQIRMTIWGELQDLQAPLHVLALELLRFSGLVPLQGTVYTQNGLGWVVLDQPVTQAAHAQLRNRGFELLCEGQCWYSPRNGKVYGFSPSNRGVSMHTSALVSVILNRLVVLSNAGRQEIKLGSKQALNLLQSISGVSLFSSNKQHNAFVLNHLLVMHGVHQWSLPSQQPQVRAATPSNLWQRSPFSPRQFAI